MKNLPSIFNDVIGPVMRGPSSSHTAAGWRVAQMAVQILGEPLEKALIRFDKDGAWATNYEEQGTVLGINGGLLQIDMADDKMKNTATIAKKRGISITYSIDSFENNHANSMLFNLKGADGNQLEILAASLGGGSFEIQKVDGFRTSLKGDQYLMMIWAKEDISQSIMNLKTDGIHLEIQAEKNSFLYVLSTTEKFDKRIIQDLSTLEGIEKTALVFPIMPVVSGNETPLPFSNIASLIEYGNHTNLSLGELGLLYEKHRSGLTNDNLMSKMDTIVEIIEHSIKIGIKGTKHSDRILPQQSHLISRAAHKGKIIKDSILNTIIENVSAIMESKSSLEVIVANPTAGSCGTVGAALAAVSNHLGSSKKEKLMSYYAAGIVGAYFAMGPGFSAEEHGCQVECGASAGMAAAGIVELYGGTVEAALGAASMAIQNMIGLVCDPIADRVEAPCLGKNTSAAVNAMASATMAVSGFNHLIPLDQVIETVSRVSADMPTCVKCTGLGGLAITKAAQELKEKMNQQKLNKANSS